MTALILDTSGTESYIVIAYNGVVLSQNVISETRHLSKFLLPSIQSILQDHKVDYIAIGTGPGTFTGTRVGAMVAKSLAYAWQVPLIPFSSTLLPNLEQISCHTYEKYLSGDMEGQIELVYFSSTP